MSDQQSCHVFLSHNSRDKSQIEFIAKYIERCGLTTWFDKARIFGGDSIPMEIQTAMSGARSAAIFIGTYGLGPHQISELEFFHMRYPQGHVKIIPILLPGVDKLPVGPEYALLERFKWISLSFKEDEKALNELIGSIKKWLNQWAEREIERLLEQKREAERRLKQIEQEISLVEDQMGVKLTPQRQEALDWLSRIGKQSKIIALKILRECPNINAEIKERDGGLGYFCTDLETLLDLIYYAFKVKNLAILEAIFDIELSLRTLETIPTTEKFEAYTKFLDLLKNMMIEQDLDEAIRQELEKGLNQLRKDLQMIL